jgi:hypothetical protein
MIKIVRTIWTSMKYEHNNNVAQDLVSYMVCTETVDLLAGYFQLVRDPIDSSPEVAEFLLSSLQFLTALTSAVEVKVINHLKKCLSNS